MSTAQRRALLTILGLVVAGHGVRLWLLAPGEAPGSVTLLAPAGAAALARHQGAAGRAGKPLATGERVDLNTASAAELTRLPRVGQGLARRIVADREMRGPFRSLADVDRVPGVGPALLREIAPWVVQGVAAGQGAGGAGQDGWIGGRVAAGRAPGRSRDDTETGPRGLPAPPPHPPALLDLNQATEADLLRLPGIGGTKARAIVAYRQARGPFASVEALIGVPGIGPATLAELRGLVTVR